MKYAFFVIFLCLGTLVQAQNNIFLDQAYWQKKPGIEAVKADIAKGNSPSELNPNNFDAVVMAINGGATNETVKYLLTQEGNDVNKLTHDGRTYIFWAASKGNTELMEYLVSKGAKIKGVQDNHGYSVLNFAANSGQQDTRVYDICLVNGADLVKDLSHEGANALLLATPADASGKLTEYFISKGLSLKSTDAQGNTAFNYAARSGNIELMKQLKAKGVPFTENAMIMASIGSRRGAASLEAFQYLESLGIKPTVTGKNGDNVLHALVRRQGQQELVKYFLSKGVKADQANQEGNTAFMNAATSNRELATLQLLLPAISDINKTNKAGLSALSLAIKGNSPEVVDYLVKNGANVNIADAKGESLVTYLFASYNPRQPKDFEAKMNMLKNAGLNITAPQQNGNTLYHLAVATNDVAVLQMVQKLGIDVNARNKDGFTALHKAAMLAKDDAVLKYLLSVGAKKDITTSYSETAFDLASENENFSKQKISVGFLK
jgi:ankyrin repeat protein